jgi:hypothetical protein
MENTTNANTAVEFITTMMPPKYTSMTDAFFTTVLPPAGANMTDEQYNIILLIQQSFMALHYAIALGILVFNGFFVVTVLASDKLKNFENVLLVKLSVFDILAGVSVVVNSTANLYHPVSTKFCLAAAYITGISFIGSFFSLMDISLERYYKVSHALTYMRRITRRSTTVYVICELIVIGLITLVNALLARYKKSGEKVIDSIRCMPMAYTNQSLIRCVLAVIVLGVPLLISTVVYLRLACIARKHSRAMKSQTLSGSILTLPSITVDVAERSTSLSASETSYIGVPEPATDNAELSGNSSRPDSQNSMNKLPTEINTHTKATTVSPSEPATLKRAIITRTGTSSSTPNVTINKKRINMVGIILLAQYLSLFPLLFNKSVVNMAEQSFAMAIVSKVLRETFNAILFINAMVNPIIYPFRCPEIRREMNKLMEKIIKSVSRRKA